jgi:hypothetical protein
VDDFYAARDNTMPPLPWPSIAPPTTIAETSKASGISESQISRMRGVLAKLELKKWITIEPMIDHGWKQSKEWADGKVERDFTPDAIEATAQALAKELSGVRSVPSLVSVPDILARAIEIISPALPDRLIQSEPFWDALNTSGRALLAECDGDGDGDGDEAKDVGGDTGINDF